MWVAYLKTTTKHTEKQNQNNRCLDILLGTEFLLSTPMTSITVYMLKSPISWWHSHPSPRHMCSLPWQLQVGIHRHLKCSFVKVKLILPQIYAFFRVVSSEKKIVLPIAKDRNRDAIPHIPLFHPSPDSWSSIQSISLICFFSYYCHTVSVASHWGICINLLTDLPASCPFQCILD